MKDTEDYESHAIVPVFSESSQKIILSKVSKSGSENSLFFFFLILCIFKYLFLFTFITNIGYIPHVVQYILEPILHPLFCISHSPKYQLLSRVQLFATHGLYPARLLCPWNSPGENTGVGSQPFSSPGDLPDPVIESGSNALQGGSLPSELLEKPCSPKCVRENLES